MSSTGRHFCRQPREFASGVHHRWSIAQTPTHRFDFSLNRRVAILMCPRDRRERKLEHLFDSGNYRRRHLPFFLTQNGSSFFPLGSFNLNLLQVPCLRARFPFVLDRCIPPRLRSTLPRMWLASFLTLMLIRREKRPSGSKQLVTLKPYEPFMRLARTLQPGLDLLLLRVHSATYCRLERSCLLTSIKAESRGAVSAPTKCNSAEVSLGKQRPPQPRRSR